MKDGDGKMNMTILDTPCAELPGEISTAAKQAFMRVAKKLAELAAPVLKEERR